MQLKGDNCCIDKIRRPIEEHEKPHLLAVAVTLKRLRAEAGISQGDIAYRAGIAPNTYWRIESCRRRTRKSTLARILKAIDREDMLDDLVKWAGPALAEESPRAEQIERRKARHLRRVERIMAAQGENPYWATVQAKSPWYFRGG